MSWRPESRASMMRAILYAAFGILVLVAITFVGEDVRHHLDGIDSWLLKLGPMAQAAYVIVTIIGTTILLPESLFGILAGMLFGITRGALLAFTANLLAASLQFTLAKHCLPRNALRLIGSSTMRERLDKALQAADFRLQAAVRLTPLNSAAVNYVLGAHGVAFGPFILASTLSFTHIFAEVYLGYAGSHALRRISGGLAERSYMHDVVIGSGLLATIIGLIVISRIAMKAFNRAATTIERRGAP